MPKTYCQTYGCTFSHVRPLANDESHGFATCNVCGRPALVRFDIGIGAAIRVVNAESAPEDAPSAERRCDSTVPRNITDVELHAVSLVSQPYDPEHGGGEIVSVIGVRDGEELATCVACDEIKPCRERIPDRGWKFCSDECVADFLERIELIVKRINRS